MAALSENSSSGRLDDTKSADGERSRRQQVARKIALDALKAGRQAMEVDAKLAFRSSSGF